MRNKDTILLEQAYQKIQERNLVQENNETYNASKHGDYVSLYLGFDNRGQVARIKNGVDFNKLDPSIQSSYVQITDKGYAFDPRTKQGQKLLPAEFNTPAGKQILNNLKEMFPGIGL